MAQRRRRRIRPADAGQPVRTGGSTPADGDQDRATGPDRAEPERPGRAARPGSGGAPGPATPATVPAARGADGGAPRRTRERAGEDRETERGLRGLVGGGASQVGVSAAMRARDAARPTAEDLAAAEESLPIVLRGWVPRDPPPAR